MNENNEIKYKKKNERKILKKGEKIDEFKIEACIGRGGFGDIYGVSIPGKNEFYAMKIEDELIPNSHSYLFKEQRIFKTLQNSLSFPRFIKSGISNHYRFIVMELLGPSLSSIRRELKKGHFTLSTTLRVGIKMLRCIEHFHQNGLIHCDIKPGNFLLRPDSLHFLALVDYGLSREYIDFETKQHKRQLFDVGYFGTSKYSSLNSMERTTISRRDDLISWFYSLYEMKNGFLPWQGKETLDIMQMKFHFAKSNFFKTMPPEFEKIYEYLMELKYDEKPNYDFIVDIILQIMIKENINMKDPYDWESLSRIHIISFSPIAELPKSVWFHVDNPKPILSMPGKTNYSMLNLCDILCLTLCCF